MHRPVFIISLFVALVLLFAACQGGTPGQTPGPTPNPSPTPEPEGEPLEPNGTVTGVDGVSLGAPEGALESTVGVNIEKFTGHPDVPPLGVLAVGDPYRINSSRIVQTPIDAPLVLALPLPAGSEPDELAFAIYMFGPPGGHTGGWSLVEAFHDAETGLMLAPVYGAMEQGILASLVEADTEGLATTDGIEPQASIVGRFAARCLDLPTYLCDTDLEEDLARAGEVIVQQMTDKRHFRAPFLRPYLTGSASLSIFPPSASFSAQAARYLIDIKAKGTIFCDDVNGKYVGLLAMVIICIDSDDLEPVTGNPASGVPGVQQVVSHEVFHAIQWSYGAKIQLAMLLSPWITESTATAIERSRDVMEGDRQRWPRDVGWSITATGDNDDSLDENDSLQYRLQDFWVFVGRRMGVGVEYLRFILANGPTLDEVDGTLRDLFAPAYGLRAAHWDWVKNQVFESRVDMGLDNQGNPIVNEACVFNDAVAVPVTSTFDPGASGGDFLNYVFSIGPLAARVLRIDFVSLPDAGYEATIEVPMVDSAPLSVKVYEDHATATTACLNEPEGGPFEVSVDAGVDRSVYVLVANGELAPAKDMDDTDWLRPSIQVRSESVSTDIVSPDDGARFDEGEVVFFEAEASGPNDLGWVDWETDTDHLITPLAQFRAQTDLSDLLCPGNHEVTASVTDDAGLTASSSITIAVDNVTPVVSMAPNAPVGEDNWLSFDGSVVDVTCNDARGGSSSGWRVDGSFKASGNELRGVRLRDGTAGQQINVRFFHEDPWGATGIVDETYTILAKPANGWPPQPDIESLNQNQSTDLATMELSMRGGALDAEDGQLSGGALVWRIEGTQVGTGREVTIRLSDYGFTNPSATYEVELEATDSDGNEVSATTPFSIDIAQ